MSADSKIHAIPGVRDSPVFMTLGDDRGGGPRAELLGSENPAGQWLPGGVVALRRASTDPARTISRARRVNSWF
jgi:hypothetical protein